jgi:hypothetical protein
MSEPGYQPVVLLVEGTDATRAGQSAACIKANKKPINADGLER